MGGQSMDGFLDQLVNIAEYTKMMLPQMMEGLGVTLQVFALTCNSFRNIGGCMSFISF